MSLRWQFALTVPSFLVLAPTARAAAPGSVPFAWTPTFPIVVAGIAAGGLLLALVLTMLIQGFGLGASSAQRSEQDGTRR